MSIKEQIKPIRRAHKSKILHRASNPNMGSNAPRSIPIVFQIAIDSLDSSKVEVSTTYVERSNVLEHFHLARSHGLEGDGRSAASTLSASSKDMLLAALI